MPGGLANAHAALKKKQKKGGGVATNTTATGNVTNAPESDDLEYLAPITVGGQEMVMDFDTGSSDL